MSDIVTYHPANPDPLFGACRNTGESGVDGVVFHGIEPHEGAFTFIGRPSILEAVGLFFGGLTPRQVTERLSDETKPQQKIKELQAKLDAANQKLAERQAFFDALRDAGLVAPDVS